MSPDDPVQKLLSSSVWLLIDQLATEAFGQIDGERWVSWWRNNLFYFSGVESSCWPDAQKMIFLCVQDAGPRTSFSFFLVGTSFIFQKKLFVL